MASFPEGCCPLPFPDGRMVLLYIPTISRGVDDLRGIPKGTVVHFSYRGIGDMAGILVGFSMKKSRTRFPYLIILVTSGYGVIVVLVADFRKHD